LRACGLKPSDDDERLGGGDRLREVTVRNGTARLLTGGSRYVLSPWTNGYSRP
jgi:hypothetical protein